MSNQDFWMFLNKIKLDIIAGIFGSILLSMIAIGFAFGFRHIISEKLRNYIETLVAHASGREPFRRTTPDIALNEITSSLDNTRLIFIRVGNFNISTRKYRDVVSDMIKSDHIWDYHINLKSSFSDPQQFLSDFYDIQHNQIQELKPLTTVEFAQIQRKDFIQSIDPKLDRQGIDSSFSDVIIQGIIERTTGYPRLADLISPKLTFTRITLFYADEAHELDKLVLQQVGIDIIESVNLQVQENLFIGDTPLDPHNPTALDIGRRLLANP